MGLSRNKVAVPEGAAGSPPFYGEYHFGAWHGVAGVVPVGAGRAGVEGSLRLLAGAGMGMLLGSLAATAPGGGWRTGCPPWPAVPVWGWLVVVWRGGLRTG